MTRPGRKVLVTGAAGFIGRHLVRDQLARGNTVTAIDVNTGGLEESKQAGDLVSVQVDIRSTEELRPYLRGCDTVFHLAAAHLDVLKGDEYFDEVNVRASAEFARMSAEEGVRRFVHCSTAGVYGPLAALPANEETSPVPDIQYERSKLAGEAAVREATRDSPLELVIVRPAWVYGPNCPRTQKLIRTIARRRFFYVGDGKNVRHPVYIGDMLEALELAATKAVPSGEVVIVAGPESVSVRHLVDRIIAALDMQYSPLQLPKSLMHVVCAGVETIFGVVGREPPFSRRSLKFFEDSSAFDIARARRLLDFHPKVSLEEGLRLTIEHCRQNGILDRVVAPGSPGSSQGSS